VALILIPRSVLHFHFWQAIPDGLEQMVPFNTRANLRCSQYHFLLAAPLPDVSRWVYPLALRIDVLLIALLLASTVSIVAHGLPSEFSDNRRYNKGSGTSLA